MLWQFDNNIKRPNNLRNSCKLLINWPSAESVICTAVLSLLFNVVPFHIVGEVHSSSDSSTVSDANVPNYETVERDYNSEMRSEWAEKEITNYCVLENPSPGIILL